MSNPTLINPVFSSWPNTILNFKPRPLQFSFHHHQFSIRASANARNNVHEAPKKWSEPNARHGTIRLAWSSRCINRQEKTNGHELSPSSRVIPNTSVKFDVDSHFMKPWRLMKGWMTWSSLWWEWSSLKTMNTVLHWLGLNGDCARDAETNRSAKPHTTPMQSLQSVPPLSTLTSHVTDDRQLQRKPNFTLKASAWLETCFSFERRGKPENVLHKYILAPKSIHSLRVLYSSMIVGDRAWGF